MSRISNNANKFSNERSQPTAKLLQKSSPTSSNSKSRLKCRFCPKKLAGPEMLREHERIHTGEKPFQCQHCLRGFTEQLAAESHEAKCPVLEILKSEATRDGNKACKNGPKVQSTKGIKSGNSARNTCKTCDKSFKTSWGLSRHEAVHAKGGHPHKETAQFTIVKTVGVPFLPELMKCIGRQGQVNHSCRMCKKRLGTSFAGRAHLRLHFGPEIFTCPVPVCGRKYSTKKDAIDHFNQHPSSTTSALEDAAEIFACITRYLNITGVPTSNPNADSYYNPEDDPEHGRRIFTCKQCDLKLHCTKDTAQMKKFRARIRYHVRRKHLQTAAERE